jgi:hypothetical protein
MKAVLTGTATIKVGQNAKMAMPFRISPTTSISALKSFAKNVVLSEPISISVSPGVSKKRLEETLTDIFDASVGSDEIAPLGVAILAGYVKATGDYSVYTRFMAADDSKAKSR